MNLLLSVLQILLALHTLIGAIWKFSHPEQDVASLSAIPHSLWLSLGIFEILCSIGLILPVFLHRHRRLIPMAAFFICFEMLLFAAVHLYSGEADHNPLFYWMVVAVISAFIAFNRLRLH